MSESTFYLVPVDPMLLPTADQQSAFREYFMEVFAVADDHYVHLSDEPTLVGDGEVGRVKCPACGTLLQLFTPEYSPAPHYAWWYDSARYAAGNSPCQMPCCGKQPRSLDFTLSPAYPYARYALGAREPEMYEQ